MGPPHEAAHDYGNYGEKREVGYVTVSRDGRPSDWFSQ
jgi:hypothetical protein